MHIAPDDKKKVSGYETRNQQWQDLNSKNAFACDA
jgi:hypothetical protein